MIIAFTIKLYALSFVGFKEGFSSALALIVYVSLLSYILWVWRFLFVKFETPYIKTLTYSMTRITVNQVSSKEFKEKYGSLVLRLNPKKKLAMLYNVFFMARRVIMALIIVVFSSKTWI